MYDLQIQLKYFVCWLLYKSLVRKKMANFRENGWFFRQNDVFWKVRGSAKLTERSAEPVRSISAERSAEPFGSGRTLIIMKEYKVWIRNEQADFIKEIHGVQSKNITLDNYHFVLCNQIQKSKLYTVYA